MRALTRPVQGIVVGGLAFLVGCESVSSTDVLTSGMYAGISATATGDGSSEVEAVLRVGGANSNTFVALEPGDSLLATVDEETVELSESNLGDYFSYSHTFDVDAEDTLFTVAFEREIDDGAPSTTVTLPGAFTVTAPVADLAFSMTEDDITVTWDGAANDSMSWSIVGDCFYDASGDIEGDPGTIVIPAGSVTPVDEEEPGECDAALVMTRARVGDLDNGFGEGGTAYGYQTRTVSLRAEP